MVPTVLYNWPKSQSCWQICPFIFNAGAHAFLHFGYIIWLMSHCHMHGEYEISLNPCSGRLHYWSTYILEARRARCRNLYLYQCRRCRAPVWIISPVIKFNNVAGGAEQTLNPFPLQCVSRAFEWQMSDWSNQIQVRYRSDTGQVGIWYQSHISRNRHLGDFWQTSNYPSAVTILQLISYFRMAQVQSWAILGND